jgi:excisionase family DNA binding protein
MLPVVKPAAMRLPVAAAYLGLSKSMVLKLAAQRRVQTVKIGRTRLFLTASLDALLAGR